VSAYDGFVGSAAKWNHRDAQDDEFKAEIITLKAFVRQRIQSFRLVVESMCERVLAEPLLG
jgi:hypothetical protein